MSEFQLFCCADNYGREEPGSYQQKPYRVFNVELTESEFSNINIPKISLEFDKNESSDTIYQTAFKKAWNELRQEEKQKFFDIPHFNWDIFTKITGIEPEIQEAKLDEIIELDGKRYKLVD
jgi:uncharacterized protein YwqG